MKDSATIPARRPKWLLVSDIDDTLLGDDDALELFQERRASMPDLAVVLNSSRPLASVRESLSALPVPIAPDGLITAMGTEIVLFGEPDTEWRLRFGTWDRTVVDEVMIALGAEPHRAKFQTPFKASYSVPGNLQTRAREALRNCGQDVLIIASGDSDFDVLPPEAGKGAALTHLMERMTIDWNRLIVAGDSANDLTMFDLAEMGIVVGNARQELISQVDRQRAYLAKQSHAAGVLEGLLHWRNNHHS